MVVTPTKATEEELYTIRALFDSKMESRDRVALFFLIFGILTVLYALNFGNSFMGISSLGIFYVAYYQFKMNAPIAKQKREYFSSCTVFEYTGHIDQQYYGCCNNKRVSYYIDHYEMASFSPNQPSAARSLWQPIQQQEIYYARFAYIEELDPVIFCLEPAVTEITE